MTKTINTACSRGVLEPCKLQEKQLEGVHAHWKHAVNIYRPCDGLSINCINGKPGCKWEFQAEGPPAFSLNILLEGRMRAGFDDGAELYAKSGSATLMLTGQYAAGWDIFEENEEKVFQMVSIHIPQADMVKLTGIQEDYLRDRLSVIEGNQSHIDAFLGVMPASSTLQRVAFDILSLECNYPGPCGVRDLYLRGKALEAIACFLHENQTQQQIQLPVPADRARLKDARALLEKAYDRNWTVQALAHAVGLNEKRLQSGFQALYGCSVHTCLTRIRLDAAVTLLKRGVSVTETAASCGFGNLSHFSRIFRNYVGMSPKRYALGNY